MNCSVIICAHNSRPDYLHRALEALKTQTLPQEHWELLLVDNASKEPLAVMWNLSWHPRARHIREDELGLTAARLRGIKEANEELLVFVDDDNVLAPDYLENAVYLAATRNCVGAFGGNVVGEFETQPASWVEIMFPIFAVVNVTEEQWMFRPGLGAQLMTPCGSGMVIRKKVAGHWANLSLNDPLRRGLGRKGASLAGAEDIDMSLCSCVLGLAVGRFPQLQLKHLIASRRLTREYLLRLAEESTFSDAVLHYIWEGNVPQENHEQLSGADKLLRAYKALRFRLNNSRRPSFNYEYMQARQRGRQRAVQLFKSEPVAVNSEPPTLTCLTEFNAK